MIRKYINSDMPLIENLTLNSWSGEVDMDLELEKFIYTMLPRYYMTNKDMTYIDYDEGFNGFFITSNGEESVDGLEYFYQNITNLSDTNKEKAMEYKEYLDYNHNKVVNHMKPNSRYLALVASQKKGTGTRLFNYVISKAKEDNIDCLYLWTDETCNYKYYEQNKFELLETYDVILFNRKIKTFIYALNVK